MLSVAGHDIGEIDDLVEEKEDEHLEVLSGPLKVLLGDVADVVQFVEVVLVE